MTSYERYRKQALNAYKGLPAPNVDQIAYNATISKKFHRLTTAEYNDIMHICMACTIPSIDYNEERKVAYEFFSDGSVIEYGMEAL